MAAFNVQQAEGGGRMNAHSCFHRSKSHRHERRMPTGLDTLLPVPGIVSGFLAFHLDLGLFLFPLLPISNFLTQPILFCGWSQSKVGIG